MESDGFDLHVRFVDKTPPSTMRLGLQWGWNGNVIPSTAFDDNEKAFVNVLRQKFPNGFAIVGDRIVPSKE